jgi:hypothetical protein
MMQIVATAIWSGTACFGLYLLGVWHARGAEQHFPAKVVAMHGAVGLTTFTLVLIAATQASRH